MPTAIRIRHNPQMSNAGQVMATSKYGSNVARSFTTLDFWRICDELSLVQAALLIAGENPSDEGMEQYIEQWPIERQPSEYRAARAALIHAVIGRRLPAKIVYQARDRNWVSTGGYGYEPPDSNERIVKDALLRVGDNDGNERFTPSPELIVDTDPDPYRTTIMVDALKSWLRGRDFRPQFFFPEKDEQANYLDPAHARYAPKLAAAIRAWEAAEGQDSGRSPKTVLAKWLREHAVQFGLTDSEGKTNETGIEECAKVANWEPRGGAPRTPEGSLAITVATGAAKKNSALTADRAIPGPYTHSKSNGLGKDPSDEDIPF
ncbi:hypothetical protein FZC33_20770 [Labrys sp. KNU-23]|uniref:hypothetical protein n=1 Tax=Labrys sp. KNU-23 TaxID=2789216 RepID=UPI0011EDD73D|nr:hypothetical protein [Labrys sp. KNU-23]QEN88585.1 hypothetical protein FZC33_20770 [Labrys sp. KNU-23]